MHYQRGAACIGAHDRIQSRYQGTLSFLSERLAARKPLRACESGPELVRSGLFVPPKRGMLTPTDARDSLQSQSFKRHVEKP